MAFSFLTLRPTIPLLTIPGRTFQMGTPVGTKSVRGGSCLSVGGAIRLRASCRDSGRPVHRNGYYGFRVAAAAPEDSRVR